MSDLPIRIVSGGQTGADRAALDAAIELGIPTGGWIPKGRLAEDGRIPDRYDSLTECGSGDYAVRTELNVKDSDATLIVSHGPLTGGSKLTRELCQKHGKPCLHLDLSDPDETESSRKLSDWLQRTDCRVLNVAGPRASGDPTIYRRVKELLVSTFGARS